MNKPWLYRCSNGEHILLASTYHGAGRPPKRQPCDQSMIVWRPERGRVLEPCTGVLTRQGWRVRDYILNRGRSGIISS